jgi:hypothetical protein
MEQVPYDVLVRSPIPAENVCVSPLLTCHPFFKTPTPNTTPANHTFFSLLKGKVVEMLPQEPLRKQRRLHSPCKQKIKLSSRSSGCSDCLEHPLRQIVTDLTKQLPLTTEDTRKKVDFCEGLTKLSFFFSHHCSTGGDDASNHLLLRHIHNLMVRSLSYLARLPPHTHQEWEVSEELPSSVNTNHASEQQQQTQAIELLANCLWQIYHSQNSVFLPEQEPEECQETLLLLLQTITRLLVSFPFQKRRRAVNTALTKKNWTSIVCSLAEVASKVWEKQSALSHDNKTLLLLSPSFREFCSNTLQNFLQLNGDKSEDSTFVDERTRRAIANLAEQLEIRPLSRQDVVRGEKSSESSSSSLKLLWLQQPEGHRDILHPAWHEVLLQSPFLSSSSVINNEWERVLHATLSINDENDLVAKITAKASVTRQLQHVVSTLVGRILVGPSDEEQSSGGCLLQHDHRRQAARMLLPLLSLLLKKQYLTDIPVKDWVDICQVLLKSSEDEEVVHWTAQMFCRLVIRTATTDTSSGDASSGNRSLFYEHPSILGSLAGVILHNPSPRSAEFELLKEDVLCALEVLTRQPHDEAFWAVLARQPAVLSAATQGLTTGSREAREWAASVVWRLSDQAGNHRVVARHPGVISSMIRMVRDGDHTTGFYNDSGSRTRSQNTTVPFCGGREAWKQRIFQIAEAL